MLGFLDISEIFGGSQIGGVGIRVRDVQATNAAN